MNFDSPDRSLFSFEFTDLLKRIERFQLVHCESLMLLGERSEVPSGFGECPNIAASVTRSIPDIAALVAHERRRSDNRNGATLLSPYGAIMGIIDLLLVAGTVRLAGEQKYSFPTHTGR
jgi:hypothetical protein